MTAKDLASIVGEDRIRALHRPPGEARGLPGAAYGADFFALEQRRFFPRVWCAVGFGADVPEPGDAMPVDLAGWPLVLVRGRDGEVRAFLNICRHRAMKVVTEPCRGQSVLRCPWHAWTYDLEGRLVATPLVGGERENSGPGLEPAELGLKPVRVGRFMDFVFVNIDGAAPPFEEWVRPLADYLGGWDTSGLRRSNQWTADYPGNWKVSVEGAIEDYHLPWGHPQILRGVRTRKARVDYARGCFHAVSMVREYGKDGPRGTVSEVDAMPSMPYTGDPAERDRSNFIGIFPTGAMSFRGTYAVAGLMLPDGPEATKLRFGHYYVGEGASDPAFAAVRDDLVRQWREVFQQDIPFVRDVHANYRIRDAAGIDTRFSPFWETAVQQFQMAVVDVMRRE